MWYFSWILGLGLALAFGVLNAIWYEVTRTPGPPPGTPSHPDARS
ncbi:MAG TPA: cytochrome bd-I oxidase subunit CydX [Steroidobacteraceae bacterium]|nr:cytochrome bd-I oxidase subunit CydX [Steroidobacteraceae bacterium]